MDFLEKLLKYFPSYFSDFAVLVGSPKKFLLKKTSEDDNKEASQNSIIFLFVSFVVTLLFLAFTGEDNTDLKALMSKDEVLLSRFAGKAAIYLIGAIISVLIIRVAYSMVGGKANMTRMFISFNYVVGVLIVFNSLINLATTGIANTDPYVVQMGIAAKNEMKKMTPLLRDASEAVGTPNGKINAGDKAEFQEFIANGQKIVATIKDRPIVKMAGYAGIVAYGLLGIWFVFCVGAFRTINEISGGKNIFAITLAAIGIFIFFMVWNLVSAGMFMNNMLKEKYANDSTFNFKKMVNSGSEGTSLPATGTNVQNTASTGTHPASVEQGVQPAANTATQQQSGSSGSNKLHGVIDNVNYVFEITNRTPPYLSGYLYPENNVNMRLEFAMAPEEDGSIGIAIKKGSEIVAIGAISLNNNGCYVGSLLEDSRQSDIRICE